jgi:hypothetical protein
VVALAWPGGRGVGLKRFSGRSNCTWSRNKAGPAAISRRNTITAPRKTITAPRKRGAAPFARPRLPGPVCPAPSAPAPSAPPGLPLPFARPPSCAASSAPQLRPGLLCRAEPAPTHPEPTRPEARAGVALGAAFQLSRSSTVSISTGSPSHGTSSTSSGWRRIRTRAPSSPERGRWSHIARARRTGLRRAPS